MYLKVLNNRSGFVLFLFFAPRVVLSRARVITEYLLPITVSGAVHAAVVVVFWGGLSLSLTGNNQCSLLVVGEAAAVVLPVQFPAKPV